MKRLVKYYWRLFRRLGPVSMLVHTLITLLIVESLAIGYLVVWTMIRNGE